MNLLRAITMFSSNQSLVFIISLILLVGTFLGCEQKNRTAADPPEADAIQLEKRMWKAMSNKNISWIKKHMAEEFQSVHSDGARNRSAELQLIKGLNLGDYTLSNFKTTQSNNQIVVTYSISVIETIDGERTNTEPAPRLSVWSWQPDDEVWQWTAHANLKPMSEN
ncbi:nuclear transport factor 2 family protein [Fodinibius sp. Rm-B-1B1-1]|uniref:nuclear transport factor 2 family protein n=1 Tax=Fodinibius alkaliphilus TaxID=3140241 RepID=UPI00315B385C